MELARRTFLIGAASVVGSTAFTNPLFTGDITAIELPSALKWRKITDIMMSSMPGGDQLRSIDFKEDPVVWTLFRNNDSFYSIAMNPRATCRWVAQAGQGVVVDKDQVLRISVDPCHQTTVFTIGSDIEPRGEYERNIDGSFVRRRYFFETYQCIDGKLRLQDFTCADPCDSALVEHWKLHHGAA